VIELALNGKSALVTGGGGAIGQAVVSLLDEAGAKVYSTDLPGRTAPLAREDLPCDLGDAEDVERLLGEIAQRIERVDLLIHACGMTRDGFIPKLEDQDWDLVQSVNLASAFRLLRGLTPAMRQAGEGAIVLVASINGERGKAGQANYAASKAGLIGLGKSAARELGPSGVRVNVVAPGWIDTPMTQEVPASFREKARQESALGRVGLPADVAAAALFLCTDLSRHITGQVLRVDGGQLMV